jgi:hypothetical protein
LVSWWPAEGNANDVVSRNNGTLNSGVSFGPGHPGQAFLFDGISGAVAAGNPPSLQVYGGDLTILTWVNFTSLNSPAGSTSTPPGDMSIVTKMVNGGDNVDGSATPLLRLAFGSASRASAAPAIHSCTERSMRCSFTTVL